MRKKLCKIIINEINSIVYYNFDFDYIIWVHVIFYDFKDSRKILVLEYSCGLSYLSRIKR